MGTTIVNGGMKLTEPGRKAFDKLVSEALAIEAEEAKAAGAVGYMARALTLATMPHRKVDGTEFSRTNGAFRQRGEIDMLVQKLQHIAQLAERGFTFLGGKQVGYHTHTWLDSTPR